MQIHVFMGFIKEFETFAMRGNVVDMAVGIIVGAAFGSVVSSLVSDVVMPPVGLLIGGVDFSDLAVTLKTATATEQAVVLSYGKFIQTVVDFLIVSFAVLLMVKAVNAGRKKQNTVSVPPPAPSKEEQLLTQIRDILERKQS